MTLYEILKSPQYAGRQNSILAVTNTNWDRDHICVILKIMGIPIPQFYIFSIVEQKIITIFKLNALSIVDSKFKLVNFNLTKQAALVWKVMAYELDRENQAIERASGVSPDVTKPIKYDKDVTETSTKYEEVLGAEIQQIPDDVKKDIQMDEKLNIMHSANDANDANDINNNQNDDQTNNQIHEQNLKQTHKKQVLSGLARKERSINGDIQMHIKRKFIMPFVGVHFHYSFTSYSTDWVNQSSMRIFEEIKNLVHKFSVRAKRANRCIKIYKDFPCSDYGIICGAYMLDQALRKYNCNKKMLQLIDADYNFITKYGVTNWINVTTYKSGVNFDDYKRMVFSKYFNVHPEYTLIQSLPKIPQVNDIVENYPTPNQEEIDQLLNIDPVTRKHYFVKHETIENVEAN
jgi:hypothetical protein